MGSTSVLIPELRFDDLVLGDRLRVTLLILMRLSHSNAEKMIYDLIVLDGRARRMLLEWGFRDRLEVASLRALRKAGGRRAAMAFGEGLIIETDFRTLVGEMSALELNGLKIF